MVSFVKTNNIQNRLFDLSMVGIIEILCAGPIYTQFVILDIKHIRPVPAPNVPITLVPKEDGHPVHIMHYVI